MRMPVATGVCVSIGFAVYFMGVIEQGIECNLNCKQHDQQQSQSIKEFLVFYTLIYHGAKVKKIFNYTNPH